MPKVREEKEEKEKKSKNIYSRSKAYAPAGNRTRLYLKHVDYVVMVGRRVPDTTGAFSLCLNHVYITRIYGSAQVACGPWN
jgi:hypothetical protein